MYTPLLIPPTNKVLGNTLSMRRNQYRWDRELAQEFDVTEETDVGFAGINHLDSTFELVLEPIVGLDQQHHVHQRLLR